MYIARTGALITNEKGELEQKFYVLDEDNEYKLVKAVKRTYPQGTLPEDIHTDIAQVVKDHYELDKGEVVDLEEVKAGAVQPIGDAVLKVAEKLNLNKLNGNN